MANNAKRRRLAAAVVEIPPESWQVFLSRAETRTLLEVHERLSPGGVNEPDGVAAALALLRVGLCLDKYETDGTILAKAKSFAERGALATEVRRG